MEAANSEVSSVILNSGDPNENHYTESMIDAPQISDPTYPESGSNPFMAQLIERQRKL